MFPSALPSHLWVDADHPVAQPSLCILSPCFQMSEALPHGSGRSVVRNGCGKPAFCHCCGCTPAQVPPCFHAVVLSLLPNPGLLCSCHRTQGVVRPVTAVSCLALALAPLINWWLIFKAGQHGLGLDGAVLATVTTWFLMLCMLGAYTAWHERRRRGTPEQTWHGW